MCRISVSLLACVALLATAGYAAADPPVMHVGGDWRKSSPDVCAHKAVEALGVKEHFILAEVTADGTVWGWNEKATVVVLTAPVRDGAYVLVIVASKDAHESERLRNSVRGHIFDGPYSPAVPRRIESKDSKRVAGGPAMHWGRSYAELGEQDFRARVPGALKDLRLDMTDGGKGLVFGTSRQGAVALKYVERTNVPPKEKASGYADGYFFFVSASEDAREAERLRNETRSRVLSAVPPAMPQAAQARPTSPPAPIVPAMSAEPAAAAPKPAPLPDNRARLLVRVPANAEVWISAKITSQTGATRIFLTPPLAPGQDHVYTVRARWLTASGPQEETHAVPVRANQTAEVAFPEPAVPSSPRPR